MTTKLLIAAAISALTIGSAQALTTTPAPAAETAISNIEPAGISFSFGVVAPSPYVYSPYVYSPYVVQPRMCYNGYTGQYFPC